MEEKEKSAGRQERDRLLTTRTQSGFRPKVVYGPEDISELEYERDLGNPGEPPFVRGRFKNMYRDLLWMKHTAFGFGSPEDTNKWLKWLIDKGMTGTRVTPDALNIAGVDPDHPLVKDTIGQNAAPIYALHSLDQELDGISLREDIEFNTACASWDDVCKYAMLLALARKRGVDWKDIRGAMVNDPLHSYASGLCTYQPFDLAYRLTIDSIEFATNNTPKYHPVSPCGYDMRESGIDTIQEMAFILAERISYIDTILERGVPLSKVASKIPLQFSGEIDFFETVCKLRAARRMWAKIAVERYKATDPRDMCAPTSINCAGDSMVAQQPLLNIPRLTLEALASVFGGVQALEMKGFDEALALPSKDAEILNMGINAIIAHEANTCLVADPLGGSYYVEWLTSKLEKEAGALLDKIMDMGGYIEAIKSGWLRSEFEKAAIKRQEEIDNKEVIKVCVNAFEHLAEEEIPVRFYYYENAADVARETLEECTKFKQDRDNEKVRSRLDRLHQATKAGENLIPFLVEAFSDGSTYGEAMGVMRMAVGVKYDPFNSIQVPGLLKDMG